MNTRVRYRTKSFLCFVVLCILVSLFTVACASSNPSIPATNETIMRPSPSNPKESTFPETTISKDDRVAYTDQLLLDLLEEARAILREEPNLTLPLDEYLNCYATRVKGVDGEFTITEDAINIHFSGNVRKEERVAYLVFLHLLEERYGDCIMWCDYKYDPMSSRFPILAFYFNLYYKEDGFDTVEDCYMEYGETLPYSYHVYFGKCRIIRSEYESDDSKKVIVIYE